MRGIAGIIILIFLYQTGFAREHNSNAPESNNIEQTESVVTGRVTDAGNGQPLVGVTVVIQGTTTGIATDLDGLFSLKVTDTNTKLLFSYIGYETQVIALSEQQN
ncbi:MAG: carboxypeptidase-like regulatory domain-containing protein [Draconibacterium sp.]|nr:carboxypeptidase-like regulatory domain-containing protein [Draconibacterium sp.]